VILSQAAIADIRQKAAVKSFGYDRCEQKIGIVHFGIGAFHRAHQAWYTDRAMDAGDRDWAITGVSLRSPTVMAQLAPQDGLYTTTERSGASSQTRLIGALREVLVAGLHSEAIVDRMASPPCRIVTFTVTEKGYCRTPGGALDLAAAEQSFYPLLARALKRRRAEGLPGLTMISCDNLAQNGPTLERLIAAYLAAHHPELSSWFTTECRCPATMVDRIVPATTSDDLDAVQDILGGIRDNGAVVTEPFSQWVIEERFAGPRPRWESVGVQLVSDVLPYETAKLRMLNGAHSLLAYSGLLRGHTYVHEAIADPELRRLVGQLMREEAAPTIDVAEGQDLGSYAAALLARFANPALGHRLSQIAMDGSQKIPQRWLEPLSANAAQGRESPAVRVGIECWIRHLQIQGDQLEDPRGNELTRAASGPDAMKALFGDTGLMPGPWSQWLSPA
jgi:fructuronate reductase